MLAWFELLYLSVQTEALARPRIHSYRRGRSSALEVAEVSQRLLEQGDWTLGDWPGTGLSIDTRISALTDLIRLNGYLSREMGIAGSSSLKVRTLSQSGSFDFSFDGVGQGVIRMVDALDPATQRQRAEELRHMKVMNDYAEMAAARENASDHVKTILGAYQQLVDFGVMSQQEAAIEVRAHLQTQQNATAALLQLGVGPADAGTTRG